MRALLSVCVLVLGLPAALVAAETIRYNGWVIDVGGDLGRRGATALDGPVQESIWLVVPSAGPGPQSATDLAKAGFDVIAPIPPNAFLARVREAAKVRAVLHSESATRFAAPLNPDWKIDATLRDAAVRLSQEPQAEEVSVVVWAAAVSGDLEKAIEGAGGTISSRPLSPDKPRLGVRLQAGDLAAFLNSAGRHPAVYSIEPGSAARLLNDNATAIVQSGGTAGQRTIWRRGIRGEGQTIAILDTGLDYDSCFFAESNASAPPIVEGTATGTPDFLRRKVVIYDKLYSGDFGLGAGLFDNQGHGTSVAGNAAGSRADNPSGETVNNGMAPAAWLIVQDAGYTNSDDCADLAALGCPVIDLTPFLDQAIAQGANIHNNSWGDRENFFPQNTYTAPTADMDDVIWRHPEFLICCAAGNGGAQGLDSVGSPSVGKNVLSVGATQSPSAGGNAERLAFFSSLGWAADGRIKPDLTAPGQTVTSSSDKNVGTGNCTTGLVHGTSMASPVVAGSVALARQYFTEGWYPAGRKTPADGFIPSAALLKATLLNGAVDMTETSTPPPNRYEGWGRIHLENSLYFQGDARAIIALDARDAFTTSSLEPVVLRFHARGNTAAGLLKITLVWTDPPANPAASVALVNDLDLSVTDTTTSTAYAGNHFDFSETNTGLSVPGGDPDGINNVEMVILPASRNGLFEARVAPSRILVAPQGFALVIGGDVTPAVSHSAWLLH